MRVERIEGGVRYALPPRRNGVQIVVWPILIAVFLLFGIRDRTLSLPSLLFWLAVTAALIVGWLNEIIGKELIALSAGKLTIKRSVVSLGMTREYELAAIRNLRLMPEPREMFFRRLGSYDEGRIAFDYKAETVRFAAGLRTAEAAALVEELQRDYFSSSATGHAAPSHGSPISTPSDAR